MKKSCLLIAVLSIVGLVSLNAKPVEEKSILNIAKNFSYHTLGKEKEIKGVFDENDFFPNVKEFTANLILKDVNISADVDATGNRVFIDDVKYVNKGNKSIDPLIKLVEFEPEGWMLIANDDVAEPILAYNLDGEFNMNDVPVQAKELMAFYRIDIKAAKSDTTHKQATWVKDRWEMYDMDPSIFINEYDPIRKNPLTRTFIPGGTPLISTNWGQLLYYNESTPLVHLPITATRPYISVDHAPTGCVATATAQIMRYHEWPVQPTGYTYYSFIDFYSPGMLSQYVYALHSAITFNWGAMPNSGRLNSYNSEVAELMFHVGAASYMQYGYNESSSTLSNARSALQDHFGYLVDGLYYRSNYSSTFWNWALRTQIDAEYPMLYRGCAGSCHAFVVDGYDYLDKFHINFGRGDSSYVYNGYFVLDSVTGNFVFTSSQRVVMGIRPNR